MTEPGQVGSYEFSLHVVDAAIDEVELHRLLEEAVKGAAEAMSQDERAEVNVKAEARGAFGGVGEIVVALVIAFASGAAKKICEQSGEYFYSRYLEPRLKKSNLVPKSFRSRRTKSGNDK